jgi:hypothetical protein
VNADAWLAPFAPEARVQPRRPKDPEALSFAGVSRDALYRLLASGAIACERGQAPTRRDGRRGAARIFVTLQSIAEWRASRFIPVTEIGPPANTPLPTRGDRGRAS